MHPQHSKSVPAVNVNEHSLLDVAFDGPKNNDSPALKSPNIENKPGKTHSKSPPLSEKVEVGVKPASA